MDRERDAPPHHFDHGIEGCRVLTADGAVVGHVDRVRDGEAFVRPVEGLLDGRGPWLGGQERAVGAFHLEREAVESVTAEAVALRPIADAPRRSERPAR